MALCSKKTCTSGKPALWQPMILLWGKGYRPGSHEPIVVNVEHIWLCSDCCKTAHPMHFVDQAAVRNITMTIAAEGKRIPDWANAKLAFMVPETNPMSDQAVVI